jgi:hypothetical protein
MKKIKSFHEYQTINEEIGIKSIATILTSLLLTFKSVEATPLIQFEVPSWQYLSDEDKGKSITTFNKDMDKIQKDLLKLRSERDNAGIIDEKLNTIIDKCVEFKTDYNAGLSASTRKYYISHMFNSIDDMTEVTNLLHNYISENNINDVLIDDTLDTLDTNIQMIKSGNYKNLTIDYKRLLNDYERWLTEQPVSTDSEQPVSTDYDKKEIGGGTTVLLVLLLFLSMILTAIYLFSGSNNGDNGGYGEIGGLGRR